MDSTLRCAASDAALDARLHRLALLFPSNLSNLARHQDVRREGHGGEPSGEVVVHLLRLVVERVGEVEQRELEEPGVRGVRDEGRDRVGRERPKGDCSGRATRARARRARRDGGARRTRTIGRPRRARDPPCTRVRRG